MTIKTKTIKNPREFPYQQYTAKIKKCKFESNLYEDNGGSLYVESDDKDIYKEDGKLEDWIDEAMEMSDFYHNLVDFLREVRDARNNKD